MPRTKRQATKKGHRTVRTWLDVRVTLTVPAYVVARAERLRPRLDGATRGAILVAAMQRGMWLMEEYADEQEARAKRRGRSGRR